MIISPRISMIYTVMNVQNSPVFPHNLRTFDCHSCPLLTSLPKNIPINTYFDCCHWLPQNSKYYPNMLPKLLVCQRTVRIRRLRKFVRLTTSRSFNEYFFHPERKGGIWAKKQLEKQMCK